MSAVSFPKANRHTYPPPVVYVVRMPPLRAVCRYDNRRHSASLRQPIDNFVPTRGGVGITHGSSRRSSKDGGYGNIFPKNPPYRVFPAAGDPMDRRRQTARLLRLRPTSVLRSFQPRPHGRLKTLAGRAVARERRALALLPSCPPPAPTPSSHR
jgi:hypothetical protein